MRSNSSDARDQFGCLKDYNDFIKYHNDLLREAVSRLRKEHPNVHILIGDYYTAMQSVLDNHQKLGKYTKTCGSLRNKCNNVIFTS